MHRNVLAKIGKTKILEPEQQIDYHAEWEKAREKMLEERDEEKENLKMQAWNLKRVPNFAKQEIIEIINGKKDIRQDFIDAVYKYKKDIERSWPKEIREFVFKKVL